jgi:heat shock protein HslJ
MRRHAAVTMFALTVAAGCSTMPAVPDAPITGQTWQLVEVRGSAAASGANGSRATLILGADGRASGYAGCNQFGGGYTMSGTDLRFSALAMTRMYCEGAMELETRYGSALEATRAWRVRDGQLELLAGDEVLARFTR